MAALPGDQGVQNKEEETRPDKHFKDEKKHSNPKRQALHQYRQTKLGAGNILEAVRCPNGEDLNEWLAANTIDFFNEISLLYGIISEYCTSKTCPEAPIFEDGNVVFNGPEYIDYLMTWVESQINDPKIFPLKETDSFPKDYQGLYIIPMLKSLARVFAHLLGYHSDEIECLNLEKNFIGTGGFHHLLHFIQEYEFTEDYNISELTDIMDNIEKKYVANKDDTRKLEVELLEFELKKDENDDNDGQDMENDHFKELNGNEIVTGGGTECDNKSEAVSGQIQDSKTDEKRIYESAKDKITSKINNLDISIGRKEKILNMFGKMSNDEIKWLANNDINVETILHNVNTK